MALGYVTGLRNSMMNTIAAAADNGSGNATLRVFGGSRPSTGGSETNLLAELVMSDPAFNAASNGVLTARSIATDTSTNSAGPATWFRIATSSGTAVLDGSVGLPGSGADLILDDIQIRVNQELRISSFTITEGNA